MTNQSKYYEIDGDKLVRTNRTCSKCGPSYFLASHYDRWSCGNCGNTIFKRKGKPTTQGRAGGRRTPRRRVKNQ
jgi:small subunit ribosomal protein S27Ae